MDIILSTFIIGDREINIDNNIPGVEIIRYRDTNDINSCRGRYISFIDSNDCISKDYFKSIINKIKDNDIDLCFINYSINYDYKNKVKVRHGLLDEYVPCKGGYIWNYVYNKEKFVLLSNVLSNEEEVKKIFNKREAISDIIYYHDMDGDIINLFGMTNRREFLYYKNIIYMGWFCNGVFNGYITWLNEIGKAFDYDITIIYTKINNITLENFKKRFNCVEYRDNIDYVCDNLVTTYSTYYYPINIYRLNCSSLFIHGNMADYPNSMRFSDDIYDRYIAVSRVSRDMARGYFPTNNIEFIYNPYTYLGRSNKHLRLVSALRNAPEKGMDRIKLFASVLDSLNIPYTWEVFTDVVEANKGGLIFRNCVTDVVDYIEGAHYLVQFSRTEALSYSMTEALCCNVKVITTDIPAIHELGVIDGDNGIIIPLEYFEDGNYELLKGRVIDAYNMKDKNFKYSYDRDRFIEYESVFSN